MKLMIGQSAEAIQGPRDRSWPLTLFDAPMVDELQDLTTNDVDDRTGYTENCYVLLTTYFRHDNNYSR